MQEYKLTPKKVDKTRNEKKEVALTLGFIFFVLFASTFVFSTDTVIISLVFFLLFSILLSVWFGIFINDKQLKSFNDSYTLMIDDEKITRIQANTPTISLSKQDISGIHKNDKGVIYVKGKGFYDLIIIPFEIEKYQEIEAHLREILSFSEKNITQNIGFNLYFVVVVILGAIGQLSDDKLIASIGMVLFICLLFAAATRNALYNKNADNMTKYIGFAAVFIQIFVFKEKLLFLLNYISQWLN